MFNVNLKSQTSEEVLVAGAGLLAAGLTTAAIIEQYKELLELHATENVLSNHKEFVNFKLKVLDFEGIKFFDLSNMSCVTFSIEPLHINNVKGQEKKVLLMFTSRGWLTNNGINLSLVKFMMLSKDEWNAMYVKYCNLAIDKRYKIISEKNIIPVPTRIFKENYKENDSTYFRTINDSYTELFFKYENFDISECKLNSNGIAVKSINDVVHLIPFIKLDGDSYLTDDYSNNIKLAYNENCLGIFFKDLTRLSQIKRSTINKIHEFIN